MKLIHRDDLHRGGFAGLRETRVIMHPGVWGPSRLPGTSPGLGRWVYLADARFLPHGDTTLHPHKEIDVLSLMVEGRIHHEGSLEHGQELKPWDVQVQRAGGEGFTHNEVNPDDVENRMIQFWAVPETPGEPASYRLYHVEEGDCIRVYGGPKNQDDTYPAHTLLEVARLRPGDRLRRDGEVLAYQVTGEGRAGDTPTREGHVVHADGLDFKAVTDCALVVGSLKP